MDCLSTLPKIYDANNKKYLSCIVGEVLDIDSNASSPIRTTMDLQLAVISGMQKHKTVKAQHRLGIRLKKRDKVVLFYDGHEISQDYPTNHADPGTYHIRAIQVIPNSAYQDYKKNGWVKSDCYPIVQLSDTDNILFMY